MGAHPVLVPFFGWCARPHPIVTRVDYPATPNWWCGETSHPKTDFPRTCDHASTYQGIKPGKSFRSTARENVGAGITTASLTQRPGPTGHFGPQDQVSHLVAVRQPPPPPSSLRRLRLLLRHTTREHEQHSSSTHGDGVGEARGLIVDCETLVDIETRRETVVPVQGRPQKNHTKFRAKTSPAGRPCPSPSNQTTG